MVFWLGWERLRRWLCRRCGDEQGIEMVEMALLAALVVIVSIVIIRKIGFGIQDSFSELCQGIRGNQADCRPF